MWPRRLLLVLILLLLVLILLLLLLLLLILLLILLLLLVLHRRRRVIRPRHSELGLDPREHLPLRLLLVDPLDLHRLGGVPRRVGHRICPCGAPLAHPGVVVVEGAPHLNDTPRAVAGLVQLLHGEVRILLGGERDEREAARLARLVVHRQLHLGGGGEAALR